jgi:uncharacterized protein
MSPSSGLADGRQPSYPFDRAFYEDLVARRGDFARVSRETVSPEQGGYAFRVEAGQAFRLVMLEGAQIIDAAIWNGDDPSEHYASGAQVAIEGMQVSRLTRLWGTPPQSRPMATVIADTPRTSHSDAPLHAHVSPGAQCNPHLWAHYGGGDVRTCYDNFRRGLASVGMSQRSIIDNMNLFQMSGVDPVSGDYVFSQGHAEAGDHLELYAEIPLLVAVSVCPGGDGGTVESGADWCGARVPLRPIGVEVYDTGVTPLGWPYP